MKNLIFLLFATIASGSGFIGGSGTGGGGPDTTSIARDGTRPPTANQPWSTFKITGLGNPTLAQDAATKNYVDTQGFITSETDPLSIHLNGNNSPSASINWGAQSLLNVKHLSILTSTDLSGSASIYINSDAGDGAGARQILQSHAESSAGGYPQYSFIRARGTKGTPSGVLSGDVLSDIITAAHDGTTYSGRLTRMYTRAEESFGVGAHGTSLGFKTTPIGTATDLDVLKLGDDGSVTLSRGTATSNLLWLIDGVADIGTQVSGRPNKIFGKSELRAGSATNYAQMTDYPSAALVSESATQSSTLNILQAGAGGSATVPLIQFWKSGGTIASPTATISGEIMMQVSMLGADSGSVAYGAHIQTIADSTWTPTSHATRIAFQNTPSGSTTTSPAFIIEQNGDADLVKSGSAFRCNTDGGCLVGNLGAFRPDIGYFKTEVKVGDSTSIFSDSVQWTETATPSAPPAAKWKSYFKSDGKFYKLSPSSVETEIGSGTTPGGANTQVQFNDSGVFGGDSDFIWDKTNNRVSFLNGVTSSSAKAITSTFSIADSSGTHTGVSMIGTPAGNTPSLINNVHLKIAAGYTGSGGTTVLLMDNDSGSTSALNFANQGGNFGFNANSGGGGGVNYVGAFAEGFNGTGTNVGFVGRGSGTTGTHNEGVYGYANDAGATNVAGGYFKIHTSIGTLNTSLPSGKAALIADNGDTTSDVFKAQKAGSDQWRIRTNGDLTSEVIGVGLRIKEGTNARMGVSTLIAGTVSVSNTSITSSTRIFLTCQDPNGGTPGAEYVSARTASTSFDITSTNVLDTCIVAWHLIEPS